MDKKKVVLMPGSFNPVTKAHINTMLKAIVTVGAAEGMFIPAHDRYVNLKGDKVIPGYDRINLIDEVCDELELENVFTSNLEIDDSVSGYTYDTIEYLKSIFPNDDYYICLGADNLKELNTWFGWREFVENNKFIICKRKGAPDKLYPFLQPYADNFQFFEIENNEISSTKVRELAKQGNYRMMDKYTYNCVIDYMEGLYE